MSNMVTSQRAAHEWASRPDDERFANVAALHAAVEADRQATAELAPISRPAIRVEADGNNLATMGGVGFSNWSFGQLSQLAGAPANYLAKLPAALAAQNLNHGLSSLPDTLNGKPNTAVPLVKRTANGMHLRAITSDRYERVWNHEITAGLQRIAARGWVNPPGWGGVDSGLYYGDRSMFVFLIDDENASLVNNPHAGKREELARGFFLWNSEEGAASFGMALFWLRFVCGNHLVWGAEKVKEIRLRHVGNVRHRLDGAIRKTLKLAASNRSDDLLGIEATMKDRLADVPLVRGGRAMDKELVPAIVRASGGKVSTPLAKRAIRQAFEDDEDPRNRWGAIQGVTALARDSKTADRRVELERAAAALMLRPKRGADGAVVWA